MNDAQPVFMQIMDIIENDILADVYRTDDLIISTTQIAKLYAVNPTTAIKAVGKLTDAGILYKKRGIGMCVTEGAREYIHARRREVFLESAVADFIAEAKRLGFTTEEIICIISEREKGIGHD